MLQLGKPLPSLTHEDLLGYERFLGDPQPATRWVLTASRKKLARGHPDWRPFAGPLSPRSLRQAADGREFDYIEVFYNRSLGKSVPRRLGALGREAGIVYCGGGSPWADRGCLSG